MKKLITIAAALAFAGTATADDMAKKDAKKAPEPKKEAPKMEAPKPAPELAEFAKNMAGNFKCAGKATDPSGTAHEFKNAAMKNALDLDKFWIKGDMTIQMGPAKMRMIDYVTYDPAQKKFFRLAMDNMGGSESHWSADGKTWEGDTRMMGQMMKTKAVVDWTTPGKELKVTVTASTDGGKKWGPMFEMSCKK